MDAHEFQQELRKLQEQLISIGWGAEEVPKKNLFHYTGVAGLRGILASRTLWAGHLGFMNDRTELDYAYKLMKPIYEAKIEEHGGPCQDLLGPLPPEKFQVGKLFDVYAVCLTEARDDLAAWMTYGRAGRGYALEFDLSRRVKGDIMKVIYEEQKQQQLVKTILDRACLFINCLAEDPVKVNQQKQGLPIAKELVLVVQKALATCAPRFKHPSFQEEHEWRFLDLKQKSRNDKVKMTRHDHAKVTHPG